MYCVPLATDQRVCVHRPFGYCLHLNVVVWLVGLVVCRGVLASLFGGQEVDFRINVSDPIPFLGL